MYDFLFIFFYNANDSIYIALQQTKLIFVRKNSEWYVIVPDMRMRTLGCFLDW